MKKKLDSKDWLPEPALEIPFDLGLALMFMLLMVIGGGR